MVLDLTPMQGPVVEYCSEYPPPSPSLLGRYILSHAIDVEPAHEISYGDTGGGLESKFSHVTFFD